jgi:cation:H+ antiporter
MFVAGLSILAFSSRRESDEVAVEEETAKRDMLYFLVFFSLGAGAGIVPLPFYLEVALAIVLLVAYALYIRQTIKSGGEKQEDTPEKLAPWRSSSKAPTWAVAAQVGGR